MSATNIDHVVYGVADLEKGVSELAERLGVRAVPGGKHIGRGTHNALLSLGGRSYLEIIAIDPDQSPPAEAIPFHLDRLRLPRVVGWATAVTDLDARVKRAASRGYDAGLVESMTRLRSDGTLIQWRLARPPAGPEWLVVPFMIDWGDSPHPSQTSPGGVSLRELHAEHPDPDEVNRRLTAIDVQLPVHEASEPTLILTVDARSELTVLR